MRKKLIVISLFLIIGSILIGIVLCKNESETFETYNGTYVSLANDIKIKIEDNLVYISEIEENALYDIMYKLMFSENMNREIFEEFLETAINNLKNGVEYSKIENVLHIWPVPEDIANLKVHLLEDGVVSLYNVLYERVDD